LANLSPAGIEGIPLGGFTQFDGQKLKVIMGAGQGVRLLAPTMEIPDGFLYELSADIQASSSKLNLAIVSFDYDPSVPEAEAIDGSVAFINPLGTEVLADGKLRLLFKPLASEVLVIIQLVAPEAVTVNISDLKLQARELSGDSILGFVKLDGSFDSLSRTNLSSLHPNEGLPTGQTGRVLLAVPGENGNGVRLWNSTASAVASRIMPIVNTPLSPAMLFAEIKVKNELGNGTATLALTDGDYNVLRSVGAKYLSSANFQPLIIGGSLNSLEAKPMELRAIFQLAGPGRIVIDNLQISRE
jgi:hypothetical protein